MKFFYISFFICNVLALSVNSNENNVFWDINKCEINLKDIDSFDFNKVTNKNSKISITSEVKIRNKRINLAISEAKLKAKKKLIQFLNNENYDKREIARFSNKLFNYELGGAIVTQICIKDKEILKLSLEINDKTIKSAKKLLLN